MDVTAFIEKWLIASNTYDTDAYLDLYQPDAILDDPSVGRKFKGRKGIREYFESYFIGYNTQTRLVKLDVKSDEAYLEVEFTGNFPEGKISGKFDFSFEDGKINGLRADLI